MAEKSRGGEGNRKADRRYREGVKKTVKNTSESERERKARDLTEGELEESRSAEEKGRSRARK
jgi:signal transduction histidine kinase